MNLFPLSGTQCLCSLLSSEGSAKLACLLRVYFPLGTMVSWEVDGAEVKDGVLTTTEEEKGGHFSRSSTLTLSKARWEDGEVYTCTTTTPVLLDSVTDPYVEEGFSLLNAPGEI
ncbi:unnamed protein product [Coregonus sp. 'balchen']|nr:unnamed protein product [Coregonus sp. 'balchen']